MRTTIQSLMFGVAPKQQAIWLTISKNSVHFPFSNFVGNMKPVTMAFLPFQLFTMSGICSLPVGGVTLGLAAGSNSGGTNLNPASRSKPIFK